MKAYTALFTSCLVLSLSASLLDTSDPDINEKIVSLFDVVLEHNQNFAEKYRGLNYFRTLKVPVSFKATDSDFVMLNHFGWALERQMSQDELISRSICNGEDAIDFKDRLEGTGQNGALMTETLQRMINLLMFHPLRNVIDKWPYMQCIYDKVGTHETE